MITSSLILFNLRQRTEECMRTAKIGPDLRLIIILIIKIIIILHFERVFFCVKRF